MTDPDKLKRKTLLILYRNIVNPVLQQLPSSEPFSGLKVLFQIFIGVFVATGEAWINGRLKEWFRWLHSRREEAPTRSQPREPYLDGEWPDLVQQMECEHACMVGLPYPDIARR